MPKRYTFRKKEKLSRIKTIDNLFNSGNTSLLHPFKVYWMEVDEILKFPAQVLINVSKKQIGKSAKRNLLKRRIKEAYRLNKHMRDKVIKKINGKISRLVKHSLGKSVSKSKQELLFEMREDRFRVRIVHQLSHYKTVYRFLDYLLHNVSHTPQYPHFAHLAQRESRVLWSGTDPHQNTRTFVHSTVSARY